jgi:hypothetical protein
MTTRKPSDKRLLETLRFYFPLDGGAWSVAISPDSAGRFRVDVCTGVRIRATMWVRAGDRDRLADLVLSARTEVLALA